eukprot:1730334-Amphidinium_carterae.1
MTQQRETDARGYADSAGSYTAVGPHASQVNLVYDGYDSGVPAVYFNSRQLTCSPHFVPNTCTGFDENTGIVL